VTDSVSPDTLSTNTYTHRQTYKERDTDTYTGIQTERLMTDGVVTCDGQCVTRHVVNKHLRTDTDRYTRRETNRQTDTDRQRNRDRHTDRLTDRHTNRQTQTD